MGWALRAEVASVGGKPCQGESRPQKGGWLRGRGRPQPPPPEERLPAGWGVRGGGAELGTTSAEVLWLSQMENRCQDRRRGLPAGHPALVPARALAHAGRALLPENDPCAVSVSLSDPPCQAPRLP